MTDQELASLDPDDLIDCLVRQAQWCAGLADWPGKEIKNRNFDLLERLRREAVRRLTPTSTDEFLRRMRNAREAVGM